MQIGIRINGRAYTWDEAFAEAQNPLRPWQWTPDLLDLMMVDYSDPDREPGIESFTPTRLMTCHRQAVLMERHDYYADADLDYPKTRGHMIHALMEKARYPGAVGYARERRMRHTIATPDFGPQLFTAKPDLIVLKHIELNEEPETFNRDTGVATPAQTKVHAYLKVVDYKSKNGIKHELTSVPRDNELQVNMYGWLVSQNPTVYEHGEPIGPVTSLFGLPDTTQLVVDELEIVYADMAKVRMFSSMGYRTDRGKRLNRSAPYQYEQLSLAPIHHYTNEQIGRFIIRRMEERLRAKAPGQLPACEYVNTEREYLCNWCPVKQLCQSLDVGQ